MKTALRITLPILLLAAGALLALYLLQDRMLFDRRTLSDEKLARMRADPAVEELWIPTPDGVTLHGWLVRGADAGGADAGGADAGGAETLGAAGPRGGADPAPAPLLLYFGGNGEEVSWMAGRISRLAGWSLLLVNYRGYGRSGGRPGERQLLADALLLYDRVTRRPDVDPGRVAVMGRSIGSGVAVYVARERPVLGAVLVSPYDSVAAVARDAFPYLPVPLLLRHRFEAASWAAGVRAPLLALIAGDDRVIDPRRSLRLAAAWAGPREVRLLEGTGHNSIDRDPGYWTGIAAFLERLAAGRPRAGRS